MKKSFLILTLTSSLLFSIVSCNKDDDSSKNTVAPIENTLKEDFFNIDNAEFKEGNIPTGEKNPFEKINVNKFVINGGKTILTLESSEALQSIIVGLENQKGFYEIKVDNKKTAQFNKSVQATNKFEYEVIIDLSQKLSLEKFNLLIAGKYLNGTFSETIKQPFQLIRAQVGDLQIALSWDQEDDVDLYLIDANGNRVFYGNKTLFSSEANSNHESSLIAELDIDSNAGCRIDGIKNENIYYKSPEDGEYRIYVDLYQKCREEGAVGSKFIVNVNYGGQSVHLSNNMIGKFPDDMLGTGGYSLEKMMFIGKITFKDGKIIAVTGEDTKSDFFNRSFRHVPKK